jgi:hypothetical protein
MERVAWIDADRRPFLGVLGRGDRASGGPGPTQH